MPNRCVVGLVSLGVVVVACQASGASPDAPDPAPNPSSSTDQNGSLPAPPAGAHDAGAPDAEDAPSLPPGVCPGECVPGATSACGNCGTRTCGAWCAWSIHCVEPPGACPAGSADYTAVGCSVPGMLEKRTCDAKCAWSPFSACVDPNPSKLVASETAGGVVSGTFTTIGADKGKRPMGTCALATTSPSADYERSAVEISNPTTHTLGLSVYQSRAPGGSDLDLVMWVYNTTFPPTDDASLTFCEYGVADDCITGNPCGNPAASLFAGLSNVDVPPSGRIVVYTTGVAAPISGAYVLNVRTDALF